MSSDGLYMGKHYTEYVDTIENLKKENRLTEAEELLLALIDVIEEESVEESIGVPPWYYEQLAILYRKEKSLNKEIRILQRFKRQKHARGVKTIKLLEQLTKAKLKKDKTR